MISSFGHNAGHEHPHFRKPSAKSFRQTRAHASWLTGFWQLHWLAAAFDPNVFRIRSIRPARIWTAYGWSG
jgi:hypothetical protein